MPEINKSQTKTSQSKKIKMHIGHYYDLLHNTLIMTSL